MGQFELGVPLREDNVLSGIATRRRSRVYWGRQGEKLIPMTFSDEVRGGRDWCDPGFNGLPSGATVTFTDVAYGDDQCVSAHPEYVNNPINDLSQTWLFDYSAALNGSLVLTYPFSVGFLGSNVVYCGYGKRFAVRSNPDFMGNTVPVVVNTTLLFFPLLQVWKVFVSWLSLYDGAPETDYDQVAFVAPGLGYEMFAPYPNLDGLFPSPAGTYTRTDGWNYVFGDTVSVAT